MKHTAGGTFVRKPDVKGNPSRPLGGMPGKKDLDPPTHKASKVARVGERPSKKGW